MENIIKTEIIFKSDLENIILSIRKRVVIIDLNVFQLYQEKLTSLLANTPFLLFDAKESNKDISNYSKIIDFFQKENVNRNYSVICIGGGITTDIGAFAGSTYMRGCNLVLIPTTFLAMIDASIGGKTAVNYNKIKNNIGTFYPADLVIIDETFLNSLSEKEMLNGWAECVKVALISSGKLFRQLSIKRQTISTKILQEAMKIKVDICNEDLLDNKKRQLLNLGHSVGHILEVLSDYSISHGTAVAIGMKIIAKISLEEKYISQARYDEIINLMKLYHLDINNNLDLDYADISNVLKQDKKNREKMNLILFDEKSVFIKEIDLERAAFLIQKYINQ